MTSRDINFSIYYATAPRGHTTNLRFTCYPSFTVLCIIVYIFSFFRIMLVSKNKYVPYLLAINPFYFIANNIPVSAPQDIKAIQEATYEISILLQQNLSFVQCYEILKAINPEWILDVESFKNIYFQMYAELPSDILIDVIPIPEMSSTLTIILAVVAITTMVLVGGYAIYLLYKLENEGLKDNTNLKIPTSKDLHSGYENDIGLDHLYVISLISSLIIIAILYLYRKEFYTLLNHCSLFRQRVFNNMTLYMLLIPLLAVIFLAIVVV